MLIPPSISHRSPRFNSRPAVRFQGTEETPKAAEVQPPADATPPAEAPAVQPEAPQPEKGPSWFSRAQFALRNRRKGLESNADRNRFYILTQARGYQKKGRLAKALATIETYLKLEPPTADTYRALATLYSDWAQENVTQPNSDFRAKALEMANKSVELEPDSLTGYRLLANLHHANRAPEQEIATLETAKGKVKAEDKPVLLEDLAVRTLEQGQVDKSLACFKEASQLLAGDTDTLMALCLTMQQIGKDQKPIQDFATDLMERIRTLNPANAAARGGLAQVYVRRGLVKEAMLEYQMAYLLSTGQSNNTGSDNFEFMDAVGRGYLKANQLDKAAQAFEDWALLSPNAIKPHLALAQIYTELDKTVGTPALPPSYSAVVESDPNFFINRALTHTEKSADLDPTNPEPHRRLATLFKRLETLTDGTAPPPPLPGAVQQGHGQARGRRLCHHATASPPGVQPPL